MKLFISQVMIISGILLTGPLFCQISSEDIEANMMLANHYSYPYKLFKKGYLVQTPDTLDSLELPVLSKSKPDSANSHIKIGKTIGFAAMGFMSGLFFGATIVNFGMFQGPAFHLKPALIGMSVGIVFSFIVPDKDKNKAKNNRQISTRPTPPK